MSAAAAARDAAVRTLFQTVHSGTYRAHRAAPSTLSGATAASASLRGMLQAAVAPMVPTS